MAASGAGTASGGGALSAFAEMQAGMQKAALEFQKGISEVQSMMRPALRQMIGIRDRDTVFKGTVTVHNAFGKAVIVVLWRSSLVGSKTSQVAEATVEDGATYEYDPGATSDFDYVLAVHLSARRIDGGVRAHVVRGGVYRIVPAAEGLDPWEVPNWKGVAVETLARPERRKTDLLANIPDISFAFSASGWHFIYQLGAAECLQDNGIMRNPNVRVCGASGGAFTAALMMYGADMPALRNMVKHSADKVHNNIVEAANLRAFVLDACKAIVRDGSHLHPALQEGRVEICYSQTEEVAGSMAVAYVKGKVELYRAKAFKDTSAAVMALLASSTMGISGLPFTMTNDEGKLVRVVDGAATDFLPIIDEFSIKVKPFTDGLCLMGRVPDVTPSEFVPGSFGFFPVSLESLDHLYELGYQDMAAWLEKGLPKRLEEIKAARPPPNKTVNPICESFTCPDNGMLWYEKVRMQIPVEWIDMAVAEREFKEKMAAKPLKEGPLELELSFLSNEAEAGGGNHLYGVFECRVSALDFTWRGPSDGATPERETASPDELAGRIPFAWVEKVSLDDSDAQRVLIATCDARLLRLRAASKEDAAAWLAVCKFAKEHSPAEALHKEEGEPTAKSAPPATEKHKECVVQ